MKIDIVNKVRNSDDKNINKDLEFDNAFNPYYKQIIHYKVAQKVLSPVHQTVPETFAYPKYLHLNRYRADVALGQRSKKPV